MCFEHGAGKFAFGVFVRKMVGRYFCFCYPILLDTSCAELETEALELKPETRLFTDQIMFSKKAYFNGLGIDL